MTTNLDHLAEAVANKLRRTGHLDEFHRREARVAILAALVGSKPWDPTKALTEAARLADAILADDPVEAYRKSAPRIDETLTDEERARPIDTLRRSIEAIDQRMNRARNILGPDVEPVCFCNPDGQHVEVTGEHGDELSARCPDCGVPVPITARAYRESRRIYRVPRIEDRDARQPDGWDQRHNSFPEERASDPSDLTRVPQPDGVRWLGATLALQDPFACPKCGPVSEVTFSGEEATCTRCGESVVLGGPEPEEDRT